MKRVYFVKPVGMAGPVKIGCSEDPETRLAALTAWSPLHLEIVVTIPGNFELERNIHECFASSYSHREWFLPSDQLTKLMADLAAGLPIEHAIDLTSRGNLPVVKRNPKWTAEQRQCASYRSRIFWAEKKHKARTPEDVDGILLNWRGHGRYSQFPTPPKRPTAQEFARLDEYLRDMAASPHPLPVSPSGRDKSPAFDAPRRWARSIQVRP